MFFSIGGLPTGYRWYNFQHVKVRDILIRDLSAIERSRIQNRVFDLVTLLSDFTNLDMMQLMSLTLGDAVYIMAYLRKACFTESHLTITWDCSANAVLDTKGVVYQEHMDKSDRDLRILGLKRGTCGTKNTNLVYSYQYNFKPIIPDWSSLVIPELCHVPTLFDLHLMEEWSDQDPKAYARHQIYFKHLLCLDGDSIEAKLANLKQAFESKTLKAIAKFHDDSYHGIDLSYGLHCNSCGAKPTIKQSLTPHEVLPNITSMSVMNMQYNLMQAMHTNIQEDTPVKKLLYWHSTHQKHEQERLQKRLAAKKQRRRK